MCIVVAEEYHIFCNTSTSFLSNFVRINFYAKKFEQKKLSLVILGVEIKFSSFIKFYMR